jgi:hypothetical protein
MKTYSYNDFSISILDFDSYGITEAQSDSFFESLKLHISSVQRAGEMIRGIPSGNLLLHDRSKFDIEEFPYYVRQFFGDKGDPDGFARAWLHHIHHNPHHWQHWLFPDGFSPKGSTVENGAVEMPRHYALEMVADWMGATMAYTGSWDMGLWLSQNTPKIRLHSKTAVFLTEVLDSMGYIDYVGFPYEDQ